jgi:exopolysaccharide production protein ExoZ
MRALQRTILLRQIGTIFSIQLLRCVAATLVVLFHAQQSYSANVTAAVLPMEGYLFGFGAVGVHIFFVISGFIMVLTSVRPDKPYEAGKFFKRRLLRIYPIYWLCVVAYIGVHALIGKPYDLSAGETVGALLLWPSSASLVIGPAWTLTYEMFFYICFGFAMMLSLTRGLIVLFLVFGALIAVGQFATLDSYDLVVVTNLLLAEFLAGAAIGWLAHMHLLPLRWGPALTALGIGLFIAGMVADYTRWPSPVVWGVPSTILVLGIVSWESARGASPLVKRMSRLGDSSYVLYLIHILVISVAEYLSRGVQNTFLPSPPVAATIIAGRQRAGGSDPSRNRAPDAGAAQSETQPRPSAAEGSASALDRRGEHRDGHRNPARDTSPPPRHASPCPETGWFPAGILAG